MKERVARRSFLKLGAYSAFGLAFRPTPDETPPPAFDEPGAAGLVRVASSVAFVYREPSLRAERLHYRRRDEIIHVLAHVRSDEGPRHNRLWFRTVDGYIHSGPLQLVEWKPQIPLTEIPEGGYLFEVSVPYTRTYREPDPFSSPLYRLYYKSTAWIEDVVVGSDGRSWYQLLDDLLKVRYYARAEHFRQIPAEEVRPISPEVPLQHKRVEISLADQEIRCYEFNRLVFRARISSGIPDKKPAENGIPTKTPSGNFFIEAKMPLRHMGDGNLTADLDAYELPGVPWVSFFTTTGVALHGTYWHTDFGRPRSHGCVNMRTEEAQWMYRWTLPVVKPSAIRRIARGTPIVVI